MNTAQAPCGVFDAGCQTGQALQSGFGVLVGEVARGTTEFVVAATSWWTTTASVNPTDSAVTSAQQMTRPLILAILVGSVLVQSIRIIISRKGEPLVMVVTGLLRYVIVSALGLTVLQASLAASDALAQDVLHGAAGKFAALMQVQLTATPANLWGTLVLSGIAGLLAIVQWALMALRQAGLLVLAAMLPLAASGSLNRATRGWLDRVMGWLIAIVVYKPAAAFVYYIGFSYLSPRTGKPGDLSTTLTGVLIRALAVIAMPVLLKFFSWSGTQLGGAGGGGSGLLAATGAVTMARGSRLGVDRAATMQATGPGTGPAGAAPAADRGAAAAAGPAGMAAMTAAAAAAAGRGAAGRMAGGPPTAGGPG